MKRDACCTALYYQSVRPTFPKLFQEEESKKAAKRRTSQAYDSNDETDSESVAGQAGVESRILQL